MDLAALRTSYDHEQAFLHHVEEQLRALLDGAIRTFKTQNPHIAAPKSAECRIKEFAKIIKKIEAKKAVWDHPTVFDIAEDGKVVLPTNDLVGGRIVCATPEDVQRFTEIVQSRQQQLLDIVAECKKRDDGYSAHHVDAKLHVFREGRAVWFPVEIQVKTLLQDAWANFGNDEFYKSSEAAPPISQEISKHLAHVLAGLDLIGQAIRDEKVRRKAVVEYKPEETLVTLNTLGHLAQAQFRQQLTEVELGKCVAQLRAHGYDSIKAVSALVDDREVNSVVESSKARVGIKGRPTLFELFYFSPVAAKAGAKAVEDELRRAFGLTEERCDGCDGIITVAEKIFIQRSTDLDSVFLCTTCRSFRLHRCKQCELLTEADLCKTCRSSDSSLSVL